MLNGKFYTGLPPKMINRSNSTVQNRMESHFFWPDDTDTETVDETRVKRRASLSMTPANRPFIQKRNANATDGNDEVNTKQRLHREFARSSIQFFDNICEEDEQLDQQRRKPLLRSGKQELTTKPTETKMELPDTETNTAAIKKKHVFESKVEFYDYVDEDRNNRNNMLKSKIDMNNKIEMEKNTKNSPKLQNKRNVNNYIENETRENGLDRSIYKPTTNRWRAESEFRGKTQYNSDDEHDMEQQQQQRKSRAKSVEFRNRNTNKYRRDQTPKRILKSAIRNGIDYSEYPECRDEELYNEASDHVDESFRHMKINGRRPVLKKHVSYSEEEEEIPVRHHYNRNNQNNDEDDDLYNRKEKNQSKFRNAHSKRNQQQQQQQYEERERYNSPDLDQDWHNMENNNNNSKNNKNKTKDNYYKNKCETNNEAPNVSENAINNNNNNNRPINMAQKHLRSSLCFQNGEIVGSDIEADSTSSTNPRRNNARNIAAKGRVSVGLPD